MEREKNDFPDQYIRQIEELLGEESEVFFDSYKKDSRRALRVNTLKISTEEFEEIAPFHLTPVPWIPNGYFYEKEDRPAGHPFYAAGLYYLQEPSAMTPASRLPVLPGDRVLDLCAAPGGKATELGAALGGKGVLWANDINRSRTRALLRNIELFGISNAVVTSQAPYRLAQSLSGCFDKIMLDAPCSGEGMFRKNPAVREAWKEKGPDYFSVIQKELILQAADLLCPGGLLLYSTCTFSPMENEAVISHLLKERPEIALIPMKDYEGFSEGITCYNGDHYDESCRLARRIWPHRMEGEGHFLALMKKEGPGSEEGRKDFLYGRAENETRDGLQDRKNKARGKQKRKLKKGSEKKIPTQYLMKKGDRARQEDLVRDFLEDIPDFKDPDRISYQKTAVLYQPETVIDTAGLSVARKGIFLGELKKKRFEPSQSLALCLHAGDYPRVISLSQEDERVGAFLRGESISLSEEDFRKAPEKGSWYLLCVEEYPCGWGKLVGNVLKNKVPAGWRKS